MKQVIIENLDVDESLKIVYDLKQKGYKIGVDFDWAYHKPIYDDYNWTMVKNRETVFSFYQEELATWFRLRYQ